LKSNLMCGRRRENAAPDSRAYRRIFPRCWGTLTAERGGGVTQGGFGGGCGGGGWWALRWGARAGPGAPGGPAGGRCPRPGGLVGLGDRPRGGGDDGGRGPCREHGGDLVVTALEIRMAACPLDYLLHELVPGRRTVVTTAVTAVAEAFQRVLLGVHQHDLAEHGAALVRDCLEALDLAQAAQELGHDDVPAAEQVGAGPAQRRRPHDLAGLGEPLPPAPYQGAQPVDVQVEHARMVLRPHPGQHRLADARRPVEMDQARHGPESTGAPLWRVS